MTKRSPSIPPESRGNTLPPLADSPPDRDEIWTMKDGTKIAVGDMEERHVRNALRMVIRTARRRRQLRAALEEIRSDDCEMTVGEAQEMLNTQHYLALANPGAFFPLLEGGVYGSPELQAKYGRR